MFEELKTLKVLIVEDDININNELTESLSKLVNIVISKHNGKEGLIYFLDNEVDVIISDINMPEMNGLEMVEEIRKVNKEIPIIFSTAYTDSSFLMKSIDLNINAYITKPIHFKKLVDKLMNFAIDINNKKKIIIQNEKLTHLKEVIDNNNIFFSFDNNMNIFYKNDLFKEIYGSNVNNLKDVFFSQYNIKIFKDIIKENKNIFLKDFKIKINNNLFILKTKIFTESSLYEETTYTCIQENLTKEYLEKINIKKNLLHKTTNLLSDNNEKRVNYLKKIEDLTNEVENFDNKYIEIINESKENKSKYDNLLKEHNKIIYKLNLLDDKKDNLLNLNRDIEKIKIDNIKLDKERREKIKELEFSIDDLEQKNFKLNKKMEDYDGYEERIKKFEYEKEEIEFYKAEYEKLLKNYQIEKSKGIMKKIFS